MFEIAGHRYGLPAGSVVGLHRMVATVPLPAGPAVLEGVANVRGKLVPVLDVRSRFRLPPRPASPDDHLLVADAGGRLVALRVDRAVELAHIDPADLEDARAALPGVGYVSWVAKRPADLVLIHDLTTFLSRDEAAALDASLAAEAQAGGDRP